MVNREPQRQKIISWGFLYLLFSQEALAARVKLDESGAFLDTEENDGEALFKLEKLHDLVVSETQQWMAANGLEDEVPAAEETTPASFTELYSHLDETMLDALKEQVGDMKGLLEEAEKEVMEAASEAEVENLSIFICKRSIIAGYHNEGSLFHRERTLTDQAHMSVRCSQRTALVMNGQLATRGGDTSTLQQRIENLKTLTRRNRQADSDFPISVKVCTNGDCSQRGEDTQAIPTESARSNSVLFGDALSDAIPVPTSVIDDLPSPRKNPTDVYAICFDDQDECGGMMWLPKNMHSCNGWFSPRDARLQLAHIRDSMKASFFSTSPIRQDASQRAMQELHSQNVNEADFETIDHVRAVSRTGSCPLEEWQAAQEADAQAGYQDLLTQVQYHVNLASQASTQVYAASYQDRARVQAESQQQTRNAAIVCAGAQAQGHNDCSDLRVKTVCESFLTLCRSVGVDMQTVTETECRDPMQPPALLEVDEVEGSLVRRDSTGWGASVSMNLLFPPVYYGYQPYCYSWHYYGNSYYAYPIIPSVGGYYSYNAYPSFHPLILDAQVYILYHSIRAVAWIGARLIEGTANALVNAGLAKGCDSDDGACTVIKVVTVGFILLTVTLGYCFSSEERCQGPRQSRFFRHGRLARQGRAWANTWEAIENKVYDNTGGHLLFDADVDTGSRCNPSLQYGRKWVRKSDAKLFAAASNVTLAGGSA